MTSFTLADIRKKSGTDFSAITNALKQKEEYGNSDDGDFFKLPKDKAGNGSAVLRFLPATKDDQLPWVVLYSHSFQGPTGRWYIENCRSTLNENDPVNELNRELWVKAKAGDEAAKKRAQAQKRKMHYIANVYVVSCPAAPELEGKVMRYKFGKKIFEKIADKGNPTFADETPVVVFDPINGADFKLRMKVVDDYPNYDASVFSDVKPIHESEDKMLEILNAMKPLKEFVDPSKFKSYDDLMKKYMGVMSNSTASSAKAEQVAEQMRSEPQKAAPTQKVVDAPQPTAVAPAMDEGDDVEDYFKSIAK